MSRRLILYEDRHWRSLRPLTDLLPVPALAFGGSDLARRWLTLTGLPLASIEARAGAMAGWLSPLVPDTSPSGASDEAVVVNAAALPGAWFETALAARAPSLWLGDGRIAGARLPLAMLRGGLGRGEDFETVPLGPALPAQPVDAAFTPGPVARNAEAITRPGRQECRRENSCTARPRRTGADRREGGAVIARSRAEPAPAPSASAGRARRGAHARSWPRRGGRGHAAAGRECLRHHAGPSVPAGEVEACIWQGHGNKRITDSSGTAFGEWVNSMRSPPPATSRTTTARCVWVMATRWTRARPRWVHLACAHVKTGTARCRPRALRSARPRNWGAGRAQGRRATAVGRRDGGGARPRALCGHRTHAVAVRTR
jgi:hypothetical protein